MKATSQGANVKGPFSESPTIHSGRGFKANAVVGGKGYSHQPSVALPGRLSYAIILQAAQ